MSSPTLGILTLYTHEHVIDTEELAYFRALAETGVELGLTVFVFTPEDIDPDNHKVYAHIFHKSSGGWKRVWRDFPDAVYDRCRAQRSRNFGQMRRFRKQFPKLCYLNRPLSSKWGNHLILGQNKELRPFLPATIRYRKIEDLEQLLRAYPIIYMKPVDGSGGRGILCIHKRDGGCILEGRDESRRIISRCKLKVRSIPLRLASWGLTKRYIVQQGIPLSLPDGRVHDFRLLIQKNGRGIWEVTGIAGRIGGKNSVTSNLHGGGKAVTLSRLLALRGISEEQIAVIRSQMERMAHQTARQLEKHFGSLCELALDLAVDPAGHIWLLEVNPKPSRDIFRRIGDLETYQLAKRRPLEYALWIVSGKK